MNNQYNQAMAQAMQEQERLRQSELAAQLAALPSTENAYEWMNTEMPQGQMISGHYIAPSWTQNLATMAKRGLGGLMVRDRGQKAASFAREFERMVAERKRPTIGLTSNTEVDSQSGT